MEDLIYRRLVHESTNSCAVIAFFVPKKDGFWCICIDIRAMNKITIIYPLLISLLDNLLDQLHGVITF